MSEVRKDVIGRVMMFILPAVAGCGVALPNLTASLGGDVAGGRGRVRVLFINNTPHRAVFTYGAYDQGDQFTLPDFGQFVPAEDGTGSTLDGNSTSEIVSVGCARVFSIGSAKLLELIEANLPDADRNADAFVAGVDFFEVGAADGGDEGVPASDESGDQRSAKAGAAPPFEALLGTDFPCNALLIIRFEFDDVGPDAFRIAFEFIPSNSTR